MVLIISHILMNVMFYLFGGYDIYWLFYKNGLDMLPDKRHKVIVLTSILLGVCVYLTYVIMLIKYMATDGYDYDSLTLLILSWAFIYATSMILQKQVVRK